MRAVASILKLLFLVIWSFFCIIAAFVIFLISFGNRKITVVMASRMWAPLALVILGARLEVQGKENIKNGTNYVIMANHLSYLDIPVLFAAIPLTINFIGKKELKKVPMLGWYMALSGMIFIDRENASKAHKSIVKATDLVRKGKNVVIFPEGTTSNDGQIKAFKKGGFVLAKDAGVPIVPVRIEGSHLVWPDNQMMNLRNGKVKVIIGKPVLHEDYASLPLTVNMAEFKERITQLN